MKKKDVLVEKNKFDALLAKMANMLPLPLEDVKVTKPKPKKR